VSGANGHSAVAVAETEAYPEIDPRHQDRILRLAEIARSSNDPEKQPKIVGKRKAAIIGFAPTSINLAPYANNAVDHPGTGYELVGLNELYKVPGIDLSKFSMWFDIHDRRDGDFSHRDPENIALLASMQIPVWMQEHYDDIPNSKAYPLADVIRFFRTTYLTNSISLELGLLAMQGRDPITMEVTDPDAAYGEIHVYGVDMAQADPLLGQGEYEAQRPSCEYFIGFLRGMGIKVYVPRESDLLLTPYIYGFEGDGQAIRAKMRARRANLKEQSQNFKNAAQAHLLNAAATEGASRAFANVAEQMKVKNKLSAEDIAELESHSANLMTEVAKMRQLSTNATVQAAGLDGAIDDITYTERALTGS
jgi:hypothetical protein